MSTVLNGPGTLGFSWRVSSRAGQHFLTLLLDGVPQTGEISGTSMTSWVKVNLNIPIGNHTVAWRYSKNSAVLAGEDRGWVDGVTYTGFTSGSTFTVAVKASSIKFGSVVGAGQFAAGSTVTLRAKPKKGRKFVGWFDKKKLIGKKKSLIISHLDANRVILAKFK
jgi:Divergent InlB B-repeat domain